MKKRRKVKRKAKRKEGEKRKDTAYAKKVAVRRTEAKRDERETSDLHPINKPGERGAAQKEMNKTSLKIGMWSVQTTLAIFSVFNKARSEREKRKRRKGVRVL